MHIDWHTLSIEETARRLKVDPEDGLSRKEWKRRLAEHGANRLAEAQRAGILSIFCKQFTDFMVLVLVGAAAISALLGEVIDALAIVAIVALNAVLGFVQEFRAERSLAALKEMTAPTTTVRRSGERLEVPASEVVPGDVLLLGEGDRVPADARILSKRSLAVDESPLTGESVPVKKDETWVGSAQTELADRKNMMYMGTSIVKGRAEALVIATGMKTQIGDIASLIQSAGDGQTPLQRRLEQLGRWLVLACLLIVAAVFATGVASGLPVYNMFLTAVSLAVAAIPEGMPAVVTVALALGVQRMIRRNAIVRRLPAVETLGCASVICSDKTGTLTENQMTVTRLCLPNGDVKVSGQGYVPKGSFSRGGERIDARDYALKSALWVAALCNDATLISDRKGGARGKGARGILGDPTEGALLVCAHKAGKSFLQELSRARRIGEIPFDSDRKRMSVVVEVDGRHYALVKGAPDVVLERCRRIQGADSERPLSRRERERYLERAEAYAADALRVLALAYKPLGRGSVRSEPDEAVCEKDLIFVGFAGMMDPPRKDVAQAVTIARRAGIRTVMVTGDHPRTAEAIARRIGIGAGAPITGKELDQMDDDQLKEVAEGTNIFARVSPRHKLRIVRALKERGHVVAMTGDGVNDAPAVKEADIGVAMGASGTDVTREASAMVLADDNYSTIVAAVEEGRGIYDNVRKFIRYLLACNTGEVLAMFMATLLGWPLPLIPVQILWMNLVTDGLPAMALGVDPPERDVMRHPPRHPREGIFSRGLHIKIIARGSFIALAAVAAFALGAFLDPPQGSEPLAYARTLSFTTLVVAQLIYVFQCRSEHNSLLRIGFFGNRGLLLAVAASLAMQVGVVYWGPAAAVFKTTPLQWYDWVVVFSLSSLSQVAETCLVGLRRKVRKGIVPVRV